VLHTAEQTLEQSTQQLLLLLEQRGYLPAERGGAAPAAGARH
jgi:hypothetical protein